MAEIPRVPQATPSSSVGQPLHRITGAHDRPPPRKDRERPQEDVLELHRDEDTEEDPALEIVGMDENGHLDIAV
jgi:hypothetical protein